MTRQIQILVMLLLISFCFGCKEKKNVGQLKKGVIESEDLFKQLVDDFESCLPDSNYIIIFGINNNSSVNLTYYKNQGNIADKKNHFGGQNLKLHSTELDRIIKNLGWTYKTIDKLKQGLKAIQFDYIRNTDWFGTPINIYDDPSGLVNSDYSIYPTEMLDKVKVVHGEPIGQTDFLKRVYIITSSGL